MCLICQSLDADTMTPWEARKAAFEMADGLSLEHVIELVKKIEEKDDAVHPAKTED